MVDGQPGRGSPPTRRVIAVLELLVRHRSRRFGLSELARSANVSKPTCLGIVTELARAGYLTVDAEKRYGLGPALIPAGRAAAQGFALGSLARTRLQALTDEFATTCTASAVVGNHVTVLEVTKPPGTRSIAEVGQVYPFAPPVGLMYVLWDGRGRLDDWLSRQPALTVRLDRERLAAIAAECRSSGYLVESLDPMGQRMHRVLAGVADHDLPPEVRELLGEMVANVGERVYLAEDLRGAGELAVNVIAAPAYDADGGQSLVLTLYVGGTLSGAQIARRGEALAAAAAAVTAEAGGRSPW